MAAVLVLNHSTVTKPAAEQLKVKLTSLMSCVDDDDDVDNNIA